MPSIIATFASCPFRLPAVGLVGLCSPKPGQWLLGCGAAGLRRSAADRAARRDPAVGAWMVDDDASLFSLITLGLLIMNHVQLSFSLSLFIIRSYPQQPSAHRSPSSSSLLINVIVIVIVIFINQRHRHCHRHLSLMHDTFELDCTRRDGSGHRHLTHSTRWHRQTD